MENGLINIIIPVYNAERTLKRCLDSVKQQTYRSWRVIIVDDASGDKSRQIIEEYAKDDSRFTYIFNNTNVGVSYARNKALDSVNGGYVAFLDSDDRWEPDMLDELYSAAVKYGSDIVQCRFQYNYDGGKEYIPDGAFPVFMFIDKKDFEKIYIRMLTGINMNHVCMKLIKAELVKDLRFDTELKTAEDLAFCAELFKRAETYTFIPKVLYHYYRSESSLTGHGLTFTEKWKFNRAVSSIIIRCMRELNIDSLKFRILAVLRPYIITVSKILRNLREKFFVR